MSDSPQGSDRSRGGAAAARQLRRGLHNGALLGVLALGVIVFLNRDDFSGAGAVLADVPVALAVSVAVHLPQIILTGLAWHALLPAAGRPPAATMGLLRWYRESANALLPAGALVGQAAAARLVARCGVAGDLAGATATVDLTMEAVSQFFFTLAGVALLLASRGDDGMAEFALAGIGVAAAGVVAMIAAQRRLPLRWLETVAERLSRRWPALRPDSIAAFQRAVLRLHGEWRSLALAFLCHTVAWGLGAVEVAGVLGLLGHPVSLADALVIESLSQALRNVGFMLPGAAGVQEGAVVAAAALVGVPPTAALGAALVRRTREVLFGLPGLVAWKRSEDKGSGLAGQAYAGAEADE
ncbi:lysylphosphatidylglycerol synthase domain-containing protein [Azospirillum sp. sgz301742]